MTRRRRRGRAETLGWSLKMTCGGGDSDPRVTVKKKKKEGRFRSKRVTEKGQI